MTDKECYALIRKVCRKHPELHRLALAEDRAACRRLTAAVYHAGFASPSPSVPHWNATALYVRNYLEQSAVDLLAGILL